VILAPRPIGSPGYCALRVSAPRPICGAGAGQAIEKTFAAIKAGVHAGDAGYQYLQTLPEMARGDANKVWVVPSDFSAALQGFTKLLGTPAKTGCSVPALPVEDPPKHAVDDDADVADCSTPTPTGHRAGGGQGRGDSRQPVDGRLARRPS